MLAAIAFIAALICSSLMPQPAFAQGVEFQRSYVEPFPPGDRYRVVVIGDSLADGLWSGVYRSFQEDTNLEIVNKSKPGSGFARPDSYDWTASLDDVLSDGTYQIAVVMFGANDDQNIRSGKDSLKFGTDEWRDVYGKRVEALIKKLRAKKLAVYWVGLPIMRGPAESDDAEELNDVYREKSFINGAKFIDTWSGFTDETGHYSAYGPDMTGQVRRLRADDGKNFTMRGSLKLAHFAEKEIRKDLNLAKLERNIPLAGSEDEQSKVMGRPVTAGQTPSPADKITESPTEPPADGQETNPEVQEGTAAAPAEGDATTPADAAAPDETAQSADDAAATTDQASDGSQPPVQQSKVGEVDVIRPAISATTLEAAQNMTPQGAAASLPDSENISSDLPDGLTALASISSVNDPTVASSKPRLPLAQRPYYRVLIKGEQLKPKAGRADDFTWPRS